MEIRFLKKEKDGSAKVINAAQDIDASRVRMFLFNGVKILGADDALKIDKDMRTIMKANNIAEDSVDFYPTYYTEDVRGETATFNKGRPVRDYSVAAMEKVFAPLIEKNGKKIAPSQAAADMEKVILVGHCLGGYIINEMEIALKDKMQKLGYGDDEIRNIGSKVNVLSTSAAADYERSDLFTTTMYVNLDDVNIKEIEGPLLRQLRDITGLGEKKDGLKWVKMQRSIENKTLIVTNGIDNPSDEQVQAWVDKKKAEGEDVKDFDEMVERRRKGHYFNCALTPINVKESPYMQGLSAEISKSFGGVIKNVLARAQQRERVGVVNGGGRG